eukprot:PhF_6_TR30365/c0_g1_i1/m.44470
MASDEKDVLQLLACCLITTVVLMVLHRVAMYFFPKPFHGTDVNLHYVLLGISILHTYQNLRQPQNMLPALNVLTAGVATVCSYIHAKEKRTLAWAMNVLHAILFLFFPKPSRSHGREVVFRRFKPYDFRFYSVFIVMPVYFLGGAIPAMGGSRWWGRRAYGTQWDLWALCMTLSFSMMIDAVGSSLRCEQMFNMTPSLIMMEMLYTNSFIQNVLNE